MNETHHFMVGNSSLVAEFVGNSLCFRVITRDESTTEDVVLYVLAPIFECLSEYHIGASLAGDATTGSAVLSANVEQLKRNLGLMVKAKVRTKTGLMLYAILDSIFEGDLSC